MSQIFGRNINNELNKYDVKMFKPKQMTDKLKEKLFWNKFKHMNQPFMRCKTCGKNIHNDSNLIQQHFMKEHNVNTQAEKRERGFDIAPTWLNVRSII